MQQQSTNTCVAPVAAVASAFLVPKIEPIDETNDKINGQKLNQQQFLMMVKKVSIIDISTSLKI